MAWDPNQGQQGQGQPGNGGQEPYSGYGAPQNPYGTPPPQDPYGTPPPQNPYGTPPPQYGFPPNQQGGYGYGYAPPQQPPRSLSQAIQALPNQYLMVRVNLRRFGRIATQVGVETGREVQQG